MKNGRYIFILAVLTALLFGVSHWLSANTSIPHRQDQNASEEKQKDTENRKKPAPEKRKARQTPQVRVVTLYPAGSIAVRKPQPKKKPEPVNTEAPRKKAELTVTNTAPEKDIPYISRFYTGDRPTLEVGYEKIGFDRYIDVMERVGRLFVLIDDGGQVKLGPEVSFRRRALIGDRGIEKERYAVDRPHLIADPFIVEILSELDLPAIALTDRVVLVFNNPFDNLIWDVIGSMAAARDLTLANISRVSGTYIKRGQGIFLQLTHAVIKDTLKEMSFSRSIRVAL